MLFLEKCTLMMGVRIEEVNELLNPLRYVFEVYRSGKESDGFVSWTVLMTMTMNDQANAGDGHGCYRTQEKLTLFGNRVGGSVTL